MISHPAGAPSMGKRVFLHGYFGFGNLGDEAILDGLVRELRRRNAEVEIVAADRSELRYDMNEPVPELEQERYSTLIDIGCLEHVWDTKVCLENCMRMVKPGGHMLLHTCVNGHYSHGLHVFNPEGLLTAFEANGFDVRYVKYCLLDGTHVEHPGGLQDAIIWVVARKTRSLGKSICPQQGKWSTRYRTTKEST